MNPEKGSVEPLVFKSAEAAKALGISERKLWELTHKGIVPHVRFGVSLRYPCAALRDWLTEQVQGGGATLAQGGQDIPPTEPTPAKASRQSVENRCN
jgi:excisionase family DNA binding protein